MPVGSTKTDIAIQKPAPLSHLSDHLANERTYLAYLRTAVSLMSFGIAINRFSLFLEQNRDMPNGPRFGSELIGTERLGLGMLEIGVLLLVWALVRYRQVLHQIDAQDFRPRPRSILVLTILVLASALGGAGWLMFH